MTSPSSKHKPYTTGARPSTTAAKANVHMSGGGWVRTITATDYAWAGNDNADSDPETLVAFRGSSSIQGFYAYSRWVDITVISEATPAALDIHVHFQENVDITGNPTITVTNGQEGSGTAATVVCTYVSNTVKHIALFRSAVPSANQLKEDDVLSLGINALALAGGTIKDEGTTTNSIITNAAADSGYNASPNRGGDCAADGTTIELDGPRVFVLA